MPRNLKESHEKTEPWKFYEVLMAFRKGATRASLLGARTLLVAPGLASLLGTRALLLVANSYL